MAKGLCPRLCLETRVLILSGSTAAFQELKGGEVFNKWTTRKQAPLNTRTKEVFKFLPAKVFHRGSLIGEGFFLKVKNLPLEVFFKNL